MHRRLGPNQQLDAAAQHDPGGTLEGGNNLVGGVGPDDGASLRDGGTSGITLGKFQIHMPSAHIGLEHLYGGPDPGAVGLRHGLRHPVQQAR